MKLFRDLDEAEQADFRRWARLNYKPLSPICGVLHPVIQDECRIMNEEYGESVTVNKEGKDV